MYDYVTNDKGVIKDYRGPDPGIITSVKANSNGTWSGADGQQFPYVANLYARAQLQKQGFLGGWSTVSNGTSYCPVQFPPPGGGG